MTRFLALMTMLAAPAMVHAQVARDGDALPKGAVARLGTTRFRHGTDVTFLAYHPDGKSMFTAGTAWDPSIRQWDLKGWEMRRFVLPPVDVNINGYTERTQVAGSLGSWVALSPNGKRLAAWHHGLVIHIWDLDTGKELPSLRMEKAEPLPLGLTLTRDGSRLAISHANGRITLWDVAKGKETRVLAAPPNERKIPDQGSTCIFFTQQDRVVIGQTTVVGENTAVRKVKAWDVEAGNELYELDGKLKTAGALSPDGKLLAYFKEDEKQITIADAATGKTLQTIGQADPRWSLACAFSKDSSQLYVQIYGKDGIQVYDIATAKMLRTLGQPGPWGRRASIDLISVVLSPDGNTAARTGDGQGARFFDVASGEEIMGGFGRFAVRHLGFGADSKKVVVQDEDNVLRWWDVGSGRVSKVVDIVTGPSSWPIFGIDSGGTLAVSQSRLSKVQLAITDLSLDKRITQLDVTQDYQSFMLAADGRTLAIQHFNRETGRTVQLYELPSLKKRRAVSIWGPTPKNTFDAPAPVPVVLSADGRRVAVYTNPETLSIFDGLTGRQQAKIMLPNDALRLFNGTFGSDNRMLAFDLEDGRVCVWETVTGKVRTHFGEKYDLKSGRVAAKPYGFWHLDYYATQPPSASNTVAFSPDNKLLAHGRLDGTVDVWELMTGKLAAKLKGHDMRVNTVAFSPDGAFLASGSSDTTVVVWETPRVR